MSDDMLELIADNTIEIIMSDPLTETESFGLIASLERLGVETAINRQGRILTFAVDSDEQLQDILHEMGGMGLVEDIGLIKIITALEPQWQRDAERGMVH